MRMGRKRFKGFDKGIILIVLIVLVFTATGLILYFQLRTDKITEALNSGNPVNVLFLLRDGDRLMASELVMFHPSTGKGAVFDIPGDTGVLIPNLIRIDRIDKIYSPNNPENYLRQVESLVDAVIPFYIQIEKNNIVNVVDLLEGLPVFVANPVEIIEENRFVLLPSGSFTMDGRKAVLFLTYIDESEQEIEEIGRKQKFIQSLLRSISEKRDYLKQETVISFLMKQLETNLSKRAVSSLFEGYAKLDAERMITQRTLGVRRVVDDQELLFPHRDGRWLKETIRQTLDSLANTEIIGGEEHAVTLKVLNGTTVSGLAGRTAQLFMNYGYDTSLVGNAPSNDEEFTRILAEAKNLEKAQRLAGIVRCTRIDILENPDTAENPADLTIILGKDFDGRYCR